jgi:hypothetical protein
VLIRIAFVTSISATVLPACLTGEDTPDELGDQSLGGKADGVSGNGCTHGQMFVMGTPRNFAVSPGGPLPMACIDGAWQVDEVFAGTGNVFAAGAFKFHDTGNWSSGTNWGDSRPYDGVAEPFGDGNDIVIDQPGTYRLRFNDRTLQYAIIRQPSSCASPTMFVRGTFNSWGTQQMFCIGPNQWAAIPMLINNAELLKFDALGDWSKNWGDNNRDGTADRDGAEIQFGMQGRYLIVFDEGTGAYNARRVSDSCNRASVFLRASINNWQPIAMECENGHYALTIDGGGGAQYKFDQFGDWSVNWGDNNGDFFGDLNGADIFLMGRHHIHFYNEARYAYDRHD